MIDDPEEFAWQQLEAKQNKKAKPVTEREALKIAYNALIEIDKETPYPLAKHAAMVINSVLSVSATDWEAIAADQAMTIALMKTEQWDTSDMAYRPNGLTIDDDIQEYKKPWVGLTDVEIAVYEARLSGSGAAKEIETKLRKRNNG
jgi:hypothetical protein